MEKLELRTLSENDEIIHTEFFSEMMDVDGRIVPSAAEIKETDENFQNWLTRTDNESKGIGPMNYRVPATLLFLFREGDNKILGATQIRHELNERLLLHGGNIGYGVTPSERRKGYANKMLAMALDYCRGLKLDKVLVTCNKDNIGSRRTIEKNGGVLEDESLDLADGKLTQRYWIKL
ncbi:MAG: GNAT family N-acetyltransferase [bacterium]